MLHCKFCQMPELLQGLLLVAERSNTRFRINSEMKFSLRVARSQPSWLLRFSLVGNRAR